MAVTRSKSWGVEFPRSTWIEIVETLTIDGKFWKSRTATILTSATGSWSRPTTDDPTFLSGKYKLVTKVYRDSNGALLGSDSDTCTM